MADLSDRIAEVLREHRVRYAYVPLSSYAWKCKCGWQGERETDADAHVAEAVVAALTPETVNRPLLVYDDPPTPKRTNLVNSPEWVWATHFEFVPSTRYVSEWEPRLEHAEHMRPWVGVLGEELDRG